MRPCGRQWRRWQGEAMQQRYDLWTRRSQLPDPPAGANTITIKLTALNGETETINRTVTYDPNLQPEVELQAQIQGEHAPIKPTFTIKQNPALGLVITNLKVDYNEKSVNCIDRCAKEKGKGLFLKLATRIRPAYSTRSDAAQIQILRL